MLTIHSSYHQPSFFDGLLMQALRDDPLLAKVDRLLNETPDILAPFLGRYRQDRKKRNIDQNFGTPTIALESILRLILLKHLHSHCTYRDVERRTKTDYAWKAFAHLHISDRVPDYSTLSRWVTFFGEDAIRGLQNRIIVHGINTKLVKGKRLRTDTTVVSANIHYPTDASLLGDAIRVITRTVKKIKAVVRVNTVFRSRVKDVKQKLYVLAHTLKRRKGQVNTAVRKATNEIIRITKQVVSQAERFIHHIPARFSSALALALAQQAKLARTLITQTEQVLRGIRPTQRIVSFFQPWARPIKKGKLSVPCEFGAKLEISEGEHGVITDWMIHKGNPSDHNLLIPAVDRHQERFGHDPGILATDRGYWSGGQNQKLKGRIAKVSIPQRGFKTKQRQRTERSSWFLQFQRWRSGGEAKISWLKRSFGLGRSSAKTEGGYHTGIGWGIIGCNLKVMAALS